MRDEDGAAKLSLENTAGYFYGRGEAWFSLEYLSDSLSKFEKFPIDPIDKPLISGGIWNDDGSEIIREHVHISVKPTDRRGGLVMTVKTSGNDDYGLSRGGYCDYIFEYEGLREFCEKMRKLICGDVSIIEFDNFMPADA